MNSMEQTPVPPEFASRERATQWLGSRLLSHLVFGLLAVMLAVSDSNFYWVAVSGLGLLLILVQLRTQPPQTARWWKGERAVVMAASNKLGLNGSLMWMINAVLTVATGIGFVVAMVIHWV
jgi:hypothetical protein